MSSGSYLPPPVKQVEIPKAKADTRKLGIPTVSDRIAQTVVKRAIEPILEPIFHQDSYGSARAIGETGGFRHQREVLAIRLGGGVRHQGGQIDHGLLMKAVRSHIKESWILLYIERWLTAPFEPTDGGRLARERGTPQGGVVSPLTQKVISTFSPARR